MAVTPTDPFDAILDFLISSPTPLQITTYRSPESLQARLSKLLAQNRDGNLNSDEQTELEEFLWMNRFMSRLKLKAQQKLAS